MLRLEVYRPCPMRYRLALARFAWSVVKWAVLSAIMCPLVVLLGIKLRAFPTPLVQFLPLLTIVVLFGRLLTCGVVCEATGRSVVGALEVSASVAFNLLALFEVPGRLLVGVLVDLGMSHH